METPLLTVLMAASGAGISYALGAHSPLCGATLLGSIPIFQYGVQKVAPNLEEESQKALSIALSILMTGIVFGCEATAQAFLATTLVACPLIIGVFLVTKIYNLTRHILNS